MKKRLSDPFWTHLILSLALVGFVAIFCLLMRVPALGHSYGIVAGTIPLTKLQKSSVVGKEIEPRTSVVVLGYEAFYFGDLAAFTKDLSKVNNKFLVRHVNQEPQLGTLIREMGRWEKDRNKHNPQADILLLAPASAVPMPVVLQVMAGLRSHAAYKNIILADGLL